MKEYEIVTGKTTVVLAYEINILAQRGWIVQGDVMYVASSNEFAALMVHDTLQVVINK